MLDKIKEKLAEYSIYLIVILILGSIVGIPIAKEVYSEYQNDNNKITNREYDEFREWEQKQQEKEFENKSIDE